MVFGAPSSSLLSLSASLLFAFFALAGTLAKQAESGQVIFEQNFGDEENFDAPIVVEAAGFRCFQLSTFLFRSFHLEISGTFKGIRYISKHLP